MLDKDSLIDVKVGLRASTMLLRPDGIVHIDFKVVEEFMVSDIQDILAEFS